MSTRVPAPAHWAEPSPRTETEPAAFTRRDVTRGGFAAWLAFLVLMLGALAIQAVVTDLTYRPSPGVARGTSLTILPVVLCYALVIGGAASFVVMIVGLPIAALIGRRLRRQSRVGVHIAVYAAVGGLIGTASVAVFDGLTPYGESALATPLLPVTIMICASAVALGWAYAWRRALRDDARTRARIDADAAFEDSL